MQIGAIRIQPFVTALRLSTLYLPIMYQFKTVVGFWDSKEYTEDRKGEGKPKEVEGEGRD